MRAVLLDGPDRQQRDGRLGVQAPEIGGRAVLPVAALHRASPNYCRLRHPAGCSKARQPWIISGLPQCTVPSRRHQPGDSMSTPQRAAVPQADNEVQELIAKARAAQAVYEAFSQEQVDAIVRDMAKYVYDNAESLARMAVEETGIGNYEDKVLKKKGKARVIWNNL